MLFIFLVNGSGRSNQQETSDSYDHFNHIKKFISFVCGTFNIFSLVKGGEANSSCFPANKRWDWFFLYCQKGGPEVEQWSVCAITFCTPCTHLESIMTHCIRNILKLSNCSKACTVPHEGRQPSCLPFQEACHHAKETYFTEVVLCLYLLEGFKVSFKNVNARC